MHYTILHSGTLPACRTCSPRQISSSGDQLDIYAGQIDAALDEIAEDPLRPRSRGRDDLFNGCRFYPVEHHFLVYRVNNGRVEVGRVLHEAMDFPAHVSEEVFPT